MNYLLSLLEKIINRKIAYQEFMNRLEEIAK